MKDLSLKLRVRKLLWAQGYHCPLEVALSHFEYEERSRALKRTDLTDIDVLGIRFEQDLRITIMVADCKSGHESEPSRIFWLRGVMDFFGAQEGMLVKTTIHSHARALAPRLKVRVIDDRGLHTLADSLRLDLIRLGIDDANIYKKTEGLWGVLVPKNGILTDEQISLKDVYQYLQYRYWITEEYRNIQTIVDKFAGIKRTLVADESRSKYLVYVGLQRLALSVLRMASAIAARGFTDVKAQSHSYLFGGPLLLRERVQMIDLLEQVRQQSNLKGEPIELLPPYFDELVEIVNRILLYSRHSSFILKHLDAVLIEHVLGKQRSLEEVLGAEYSTDALVLAKRIATLFQSAAGFDRDLLEEIWPL